MKLISNELTDVYIPTSNVLHLVQTILMTSDRRYWKILSICSHAPFTSRFLSSPSPLSADHHKVDLARDHQSAGNRTPPDRLSDSCSYVHNKDACTLNPKAACILTTLTSSLQTPVNHFQDGGFWRIVTAVGLFAVCCNSNQQKAFRFSFFIFNEHVAIWIGGVADNLRYHRLEPRKHRPIYRCEWTLLIHGGKKGDENTAVGYYRPLFLVTGASSIRHRSAVSTWR